MVVGKAVTHLCLTQFIKDLKSSVEQGKVVTTLNILFSVVFSRSTGYMLTSFDFCCC
jgi:hypothetical protein